MNEEGAVDFLTAGSAEMDDEFRTIPTADLIDPPLVLREVDQRSVEYVELRGSLIKLGPLNSICVRPSQRYPGKFEVVDGRWRTACAREARIDTLPCIVKHCLIDKDVLAMQITANATRFATRPSEYARQIRRLLRSKEGMTQAEVCQLLHKNGAWIRKMLGMALLSRLLVYRKVIDRGELSLEAAYYLSRLPRQMWAEYLSDATMLPLREFKALVMSTMRQYRAQVGAGSLRAQLLHVEPRPYMRTLTELLGEVNQQYTGPLTVASMSPTPIEAWYSALKWAIHMDPESVQRQREKILRRLKKRAVTRSKGR